MGYKPIYNRGTPSFFHSRTDSVIQRPFSLISRRPVSGLRVKETMIHFPDPRRSQSSRKVHGTKLQCHRALCSLRGCHVLCWEQKQKSRNNSSLQSQEEQEQGKLRSSEKVRSYPRSHSSSDSFHSAQTHVFISSVRGLSVTYNSQALLLLCFLII